MPTCQQQDFSIGSQKLSKAIILQKSESECGEMGGLSLKPPNTSTQGFYVTVPQGDQRGLCVLTASFPIFVFSH